MRGIIFLFLLIWADTVLAGTDLQSKLEVRTAPIAFFAKWLTADLTYILSSQWAVGPSYISYANDSDYGGMLAPTYYGNAYGMHFIWAVDSLYVNSWYIGSHIYKEDYRARPHPNTLGDANFYKGHRANAVLGWREVSGSFVTMAGLGYETRDHDVERLRSGVTTESNESHSWFHAEFKAGWMF